MPVIPFRPRVARTEDTFIRTYTGQKFWPLDPSADEVSIEDIAHALSLVCRFTGHTYCFYSVAEHSLRVSHLAERMVMEYKPFGYTIPVSERPGLTILAHEIALWGLLHDASEAYLCDVPSPLKRAPGIGHLYKGFERTLMGVIAERFALIPYEPAIVKDADRILLKTEMRDLMNAKEGFSLDWDYAGYAPLPETIYPMDAQRSEVEFLRRFQSLTMAQKVAAL